MNGRRIVLGIGIALLCTACALEGVIEPPVYMVAYLANGGTGRMENSAHVYGTEKELNSNSFTYSGYAFTGWGVGTQGPVVYQDKQKIKNLTKTNGETISLYAQWETVVSITYNVAYNANGGTGSMENSVHTAGIARELSANTFTRSGYTFAGWASTPTGSVVYADQESVLNLANTQGATITLYAKWEGVSYYVAYNANGGTGLMANSVYTYGTAQNLRTNTFASDGYIFAGWATSSDGSVLYSDQQSVNNLTTTAGATVTLYAQWSDASAHTYTVVYDRNGGTGTIESSVHTYGVAKSLTANTFTRTGYTFTGWGTSAAGPMAYGDQANVLNLTETSGGTVILYAQWTVNTYTVTYNANGGTGLMTNSEHTYGVAKNLDANTFTRAGHNFMGWATSSDGPVVYADHESVINLSDADGAIVTLYAVWEHFYYIAFDPNGGTGSMENNTHIYGTAKQLAPNVFTYAGYLFIGWATSADGPVVYADHESVTNLSAEAGAIVTLYAQWEIITLVPGANLVAKLSWLQSNALSNVNYTVEVNTDESIGPQTLSYSRRNNISITLIGIGTIQTVSLSANGSLFTVSSGVSLILDSNITLRGRSNNTTSLVLVSSGGNLIMNSGSAITDNTYSNSTGVSYGGGVRINASGTFTMNDGTISGNTATSTSSSSGYGGGVYVAGTFTMNDGTISNNTSSSGGGVYISPYGIFTMSNGTISDNTSSRGGGVCVYRTFTMIGGKISDNTSSNGGGVYIVDP